MVGVKDYPMLELLQWQIRITQECNRPIAHITFNSYLRFSSNDDWNVFHMLSSDTRSMGRFLDLVWYVFWWYLMRRCGKGSGAFLV